MFFDYFRMSALAAVQIFVLGAIGYFLIRRNVLGEAGLDILSRLVVQVTLPLLIFCQLLKGFSFNLYANWWIFPLISLAVNLAGLLVGLIFAGLIKKGQERVQFLSLITFQNSGYLPLALILALLPKDKIEPMLVYLFLFLLGFNLAVWSLGVYMVSFNKGRRFELASLFSPPVIAIIFSLGLIFFGWNRWIPDALFKPLKAIGDCTLPLAIFVVGGGLACIKIKQIDKKAMLLMILAKLVILPSLGLWLVLRFNLPELIGLLIVMQLAVPSATSLSVIARHYKKDDLLISQGILVGHIVSLFTLPVFLSVYFMLVVLK